MEREAERATGIIAMSPKLLTDLHQYELEGTAYNVRLQEVQKAASVRMNNYLEEVYGVDLEAEKWEPEVDKRRFRRSDVRPPELRPELEVKPPQATEQEVTAAPNGHATMDVTVPFTPRRAPRAAAKA